MIVGAPGIEWAALGLARGGAGCASSVGWRVADSVDCPISAPARHLRRDLGTLVIGRDPGGRRYLNEIECHGLLQSSRLMHAVVLATM